MQVLCEFLKEKKDPGHWCWKCLHKGKSAFECRLRNMPQYRLILLYTGRKKLLEDTGYYVRRVKVDSIDLAKLL